MSYSDQNIVTQIQKGGMAYEQISAYLFDEYKGLVYIMKDKHHLSLEQSQDAFSDSLVKLLRHVKKGKFRGESKLSSYFYAIYSNTCVDVLRRLSSNKNMKYSEIHESTARERSLFKLFEIQDESNWVIQMIKGLGGSCKNILLDWGYYGYSMNEIAIRYDLSSAESARSMKYKCLKKLKKSLSHEIKDRG